jgi:hypothetical protein
MEIVPLDVVPMSGLGTPMLSTSGAGEDLYGGHLDFGATDGARAVPLRDVDTRSEEGVLVTAVVRFGSLSLEAGKTITILNKGQAGGYALELHGKSDGSGTVLRFGVHVGGGYVYHEYPVTGGTAGACSSRYPELVAPLAPSGSYLLAGAYDGSGDVYLFINNRCAAAPVSTASGAVTANAGVQPLVGADPEPGGMARSFFDGLVQQAQVQLWGDHSGHGVN